METLNTSILPGYKKITKKNIIDTQEFHGYIKFVKLDNGEILDLDNPREHAKLIEEVNGVKVDLNYNIISLNIIGF